MSNKIFVTRSSLPPKEEYYKEIASLWDSAWLTNMGEKHNQFEAELQKYLSVNYVSLFVNGHTALEMAIQTLDLKGEIITTPFTFASTTHAIVRNRLTPVFCDINPWDYTIDTEKLEALITEKTSAILPVHVYGNICSMDAIEKIAQKHHLKVIYDAAHAFGVKVNGRGIGTFGDVSVFSFHATKVFHSIEGGAATFSDEILDRKLKSIKNFGIEDTDMVSMIGANGKMNEFQAAMGICNLRHIDQEICKRGKIVKRYRENLKDIQGLALCQEKAGVLHNYAYFPVNIDKNTFGKSRDEIYVLLAENQIFARKYFYPLTSELDCYNKEFSSINTPIAKKIASQILTLPLYSELPLEMVDRICEIIRKEKSNE